MQNVLAGEAALIRIITHGVEDLGGDHHLIARGAKFLERAPGDFFAGPERVHIRRVKEIDTGFDRAAVERPGLLFLQYPLAPLLRTVGHGAQADSGDLQASRTKVDVFHCTSSVPVTELAGRERPVLTSDPGVPHISPVFGEMWETQT